MKAAIHEKYGPPEVLKIAEVDIPKPKKDEVLIKVHYSTVNRTDCGFRSAEYFISRFFSGLFRPKNKVLGNEFAGEIVSVGREVQSYKVGDQVFGYNDSTFGAHAEYMVVLEKAAMAILPRGKSYQESVAITEGGHYALCDIKAAKVKAGQQILVNGATGAIGSAAVQLIKAIGAEITAVCETKHIELVKSLGADMVIDYTKDDFTKLDKQFDFVFDAVGKSTFGKCKPILKPKGIYISTELGPGGQNPFLALLTPLFGGKRLLFPLPFIKQEDILYLKDLVESRKFNPVIDRIYSLQQIMEATKYVESGFKTGNVLVQIIKE